MKNLFEKVINSIIVGQFDNVAFDELANAILSDRAKELDAKLTGYLCHDIDKINAKALLADLLVTRTDIRAHGMNAEKEISNIIRDCISEIRDVRRGSHKTNVNDLCVLIHDMLSIKNDMSYAREVLYDFGSEDTCTEKMDMVISTMCLSTAHRLDRLKVEFRNSRDVVVLGCRHFVIEVAGRILNLFRPYAVLNRSVPSGVMECFLVTSIDQVIIPILISHVEGMTGSRFCEELFAELSSNIRLKDMIDASVGDFDFLSILKQCSPLFCKFHDFWSNHKSE